MKNSKFIKVIDEIKDYSIYMAEENGWEWYYGMHQREVVRCAELLLKKHKADKQVVILAAWLHDISKYTVRVEKFSHKLQNRHHLDSAKIADVFLKELDVDKKLRESVRQCILRHRNSGNYIVRSTEEKMLAVADAMSHFTGVFYFLHHMFHPEDTVMEMVEEHMKKFKEDWRDLGLLPGAREMVKPQYDMFIKLHKNYKEE